MDINNKIKLLDFKLSKNIASNLFWIYKTAFHWNWIDFAEHKDYNFWDSIKNIDWKSSAKTWNLLLKKYEEDRDLNVLFLIDVSSSLDFWSEEKTKKEIQEEIFYSLAFSAIQNDDNIWAFIYNNEILDFIPATKWPQNIFRILDLIEKYKNVETSIYGVLWNSKDAINPIHTKKQKTMKVLERINKLNIRKSLIFILTDDINFENNESILKIAWNQNDIILINIFDNFENNLILDKININTCLWNNFVNLDLWNNKKVEEYRKLRIQKITELENTLKKSKIWYINIDNKKNLYKELVWYFSKI